MAGSIYRKASLDRLASPEQLDKLIRITSPMVWLSVIGVVFVIVAVIIWSIFGRLPAQVRISGIYTSGSQTESVFTEASGKADIVVRKEEAVKKGQILAHIENNINEDIENVNSLIESIEKVTLNSTQDPAVLGISQLLEIKANWALSGSNNNQVKEQFNKTKEILKNEALKDLKILEENLKKYEILSPADGIITSVNVQSGQLVPTGTEMFRIRASENAGDGGKVVCFVPVTEAKKLQKGMVVTIAPSTVNEQEYGHMNGVVESVSSYNATTLEMRNLVGDDILVGSIQQQFGPSLTVILSINKDSSTASGYEWSNKKGAGIEISEGTMISAGVITAEKAPISMLIPYLNSIQQ